MASKTEFLSFGFIHYHLTPIIKVVVELSDSELVRYYYHQIPKHLRPNPTRYKPHISIVRNEIIPNMDKWGRYEDHEVTFDYNPILETDGIYFWLGVECPFFCQLRKELGLEELREGVTLSPTGDSPFHITIANTKNSGYILS